jgi:hypothetical protein
VWDFRTLEEKIEFFSQLIEIPIDEFASCDREWSCYSIMREEMGEMVEHHDREASCAELPCWAMELGLERDVFCQLLEVSLARGIAPTDLIREWVTEMARDTVS